MGSLVSLILVLAFLGSPVPSLAEVIDSVPPKQREAIQQICDSGGLKLTDLRNIGDHNRELFNNQLNRTSIVLKNHNVVGLCLRGVSFEKQPDFDELKFLEVLDLEGSTISQWPNLAELREIKRLNISGTELGNPIPKQLPPNVEVLLARGTKIDSVRELGNISTLREVDLSGTTVSEFDALLAIPLDQLRLANTRVAILPDTIPKHGEWNLDLDGTPLLNPPGYSSQWPFPGWVASTSRNSDSIQGTVNEKMIDVRGTISNCDTVREFELPQCTAPNVPTAKIVITCSAGKGRVWLEEPTGFFASPWFEKGKVKGFGMFRSNGYVSKEFDAEHPATLVGRLRLRTQSRIYDMPAGQRSEAAKPADWCYHGFFIEPYAGHSLSGIEVRIENSR